MSPRLRVCGFWLLGLVVGCGRSGARSTADSGDPPPHGGTLVLMPDGTGLIEVVKKNGTAPITSEVSFYFYTSAYTPYEPGPESGVLVIDDERKVSLQADGDALVTPTGPVIFEERDVDGLLRIELNGKTKQIPLGIR